MNWLRMPRRAITALSLTLIYQSPLYADSQALGSLKFTMTEYLIYTDQLQKLDATECSATPVSPYSVSRAKTELLARIKPQHQADIETLFESEQVTRLLEENTRGIQSLFDPQQLTGTRVAPSAAKRSHCQELTLAFQANLAATKADLDQMFEVYHQD